MDDYKVFDNYILRTPLFPIGRIRRLVAAEEVSRESLKEICSDSRVKEALFLASPAFYREVLKWMDDKMPSKKEDDKIVYGIIRYFARMCTRCTPFGLFAGISVGDMAENTNVEICGNDSDRLVLRLDMNYVCALAKNIAEIETVKSRLKFYANDTCYSILDKVRYVEYGYRATARYHLISAVDKSPYLDAILEGAKSGMRLDDLANIIVDDDIPFEDARAFVDEMVAAQLLVSELEPTVIGDNPLRQMISVLQCYSDDNTVNDVCEKLLSINAEIEKLCNMPWDEDRLSQYDVIKEMLKCFPVQGDEKFLFQGDMLQKTKKSDVSTHITEDIKSAIKMLNAFTPAFGNDNLNKFRDAFYDRYEDEEIPLALALDTESGIGYIQDVYNGITPLVDGIAFPMRTSNISQYAETPFNRLMRAKLSESLRKGNRVITIEDDDFKGLKDTWDDVPPTMSAFVELVDDEHILLRSAGGSSAANLIGRFCHVHESLLDHTKKIVEKDESNQDVIYAEIVHLPESRIGNILHRPTLRKHEIHYLAHSSVQEDAQISIDDLMVSVKNNTIVLRSKKHNKIVVPRLTTAHNYSFNAMPVYQFLCDIQCQGLRGGFSYTWGSCDNESYLPRVMYKNVILSLETWNFNASDISKLNAIKDPEERVDAFMEMAESRNVNDEVLLEDSDNELYLNLKNRTCVKVLLSLVKNRPGFKLSEFPFKEKTPVVKNGESCSNELLFAYYKDERKEVK